MHFGGNIGFLAAILILMENLRWPRSIFQIVWPEVHESTENLDRKKGQFLPGLDLTNTLYSDLYSCQCECSLTQQKWWQCSSAQNSPSGGAATPKKLQKMLVV